LIQFAKCLDPEVLKQLRSLQKLLTEKLVRVGEGFWNMKRIF